MLVSQKYEQQSITAPSLKRFKYKIQERLQVLKTPSFAYLQKVASIFLFSFFFFFLFQWWYGKRRVDNEGEGK